jgi:cytochrome c2
MKGILAVGLAFAVAALGTEVLADSERGEKLFTTLSCVRCHSVNVQGGSVAPDLNSAEKQAP